MMRYPNFEVLYLTLGQALLKANVVEQENWQSVKSPDNTKELLDVSFKLDVPLIFPNPRILKTHNGWWALSDEWVEPHFQERTSGKPLNPGETYKLWPFYKQNSSNDKFRTEREKFSHTYMERFWSKKAGDENSTQAYDGTMHGVRYEYGDLSDVIELLKRDPTTRQAFIPIWFPEDTGNVMNQRVPCTLGYHFIVRNDRIHITYYIRSCDFVRHFTDDVYLAMRLLQYVCENTGLGNVKPGTLTMHIVSLHMFERDSQSLRYTISKYGKNK